MVLAVFASIALFTYQAYEAASGLPASNSLGVVPQIKPVAAPKSTVGKGNTFTITVSIAVQVLSPTVTIYW